jgi:2-keto-4-pentenoate hydratase/2-oxohepta-3-ene-1,7-dioic acid hydratase in catechol pathway
MRFARFVHAGGVSFGVVEGEAGAGLAGLTVAEIDRTPFEPVTFTNRRWALPDVHLLAPIFSSKVIGIGRNYADHAAELGHAVPKEPLMFLKPSSSVIGPNDMIRLPVQSQQVEHEAELAVVIGGTGPVSRIDRKDAEKVIFGYTCANDVTARDLQKSDVQFTRAKGFDSFCPVGPWIETRLDVSDLEVRCEVGRGNEVREVRQLGRTKDMIFDVPSLVSYVSHVMSLLPGDLILTGTPAGVSTITDGDVVSVRVEGIGELINPVASR